MPISISNRNRKALALSALGVLGAVANASAVTASADTTSNTDVAALLAKAKTLKASDTYKNTVNNVTMDLDDAIKDAEGMSSSANDSTKESIADELNDAIYAVSDPDNQRVSDTQKSEVSEKAAAVQKLKDSESYDKYSEDLQEEIQNALDSVETFKSIPSVGNYNAAIGALKKVNVDAEMEGSDSTSTSSAAGNNSFASVASSAANAFHTALGILDSVNSGTDTAVGSSTASKASSSVSSAVSNASSNASNASSNASNVVNHTYYYDSMGKQIKNMTDGAHPDTGGNNAPEGYTFIGSYTLTDKDVAKKGDFYGMNMNAGDVINLYNAKNASSNASSAASNAIVSAVSSAESSASSAPSSASSSESSASSSASNISSAVSAISSAVSGSLSEVSSVASDANSASNSSSGASDASSAATNNVSSASGKAAKSSAAPVTQAAAGSAGSAGGAGSTLPKTGSDAMSNAILAVMGLASTIGAGGIILRKKRKAE